ncbi:hypothetical protein HWV62_25376 [Athelia sp. TMB]|nr:hypothetical protein HWV62_25376 [Athelia sp. TMB]
MCANTPITSPRLYSGAHTDDIRQALFYIASQFPKAPLLGVGFSLGANVLARYLAQEGKNSRLASGCILGCATFLGRHVYSKGMGSNLQRLLTRNMGPLTKDPSTLMAQRVTATLALKSPRLDEFDHSFTRWVGGTSPPFPFDSGDDYYIYGSSDGGLADIRVPFLAVNAVDDPIVRSVPLGAGDHGWGVMAMTAGGGHLGWFETGSSGEIKRWIRKPVLEWLRAVGEDMVHEASRGPELHEVDGWIKELGRDDLGCKEIEGEAGLVVGNEGQEGMLSGL